MQWLRRLGACCICCVERSPLPSLDATTELLSRQRICEVIHRYAEAVDERSPERLLSCFTTDATISYNGMGGALSPHAVAEIMSAEGGFARNVPGLDEIAISTHVMSGIIVEFTDEGAKARCTGLAYLGGRRAGEHVMLVHGIRYFDDFVQTADGWRIQHRVHRLEWGFDAPPGPDRLARWNPAARL